MRKRQFKLGSAFSLNDSGFTHTTFIVGVLILLGIITFVRLSGNHVSADSPKIVSGIKGYCLDIKKDNDTQGAIIDNWKCDNTSAQVWTYQEANITHEDKFCLSVEKNAVANNSKIDMETCNNQPGQIWLRQQSSFYNPNSNLCLSALSNNSSLQLVINPCNPSSLSETWQPTDTSNIDYGVNASCEGVKSEIIACNAEKQWSIWHAAGSNHENLLNTYTDGAAYEEWCADFVSYIYKESGYPFTQGETNGWDENNANNIINMGFTEHLASSGYIPKTGDIAFFNYNGGHVEIVISGGKKPTFLYGNSGVIDPTTGNGEMASNTIINDGSIGQLVYYLSPN